MRGFFCACMKRQIFELDKDYPTYQSINNNNNVYYCCLVHYRTFYDVCPPEAGFFLNINQSQYVELIFIPSFLTFISRKMCVLRPICIHIIWTCLCLASIQPIPALLCNSRWRTGLFRFSPILVAAKQWRRWRAEILMHNSQKWFSIRWDGVVPGWDRDGIAKGAWHLPPKCRASLLALGGMELEWRGGRNLYAGSERLQPLGVTVEAFMSRLSAYPADALCWGTFWLEEDFLEVDETLTPEEIHRAMEIATDHHDANIGYNWDSLRYAAELAKE